jgi:BRCT domain type II-containing protein
VVKKLFVRRQLAIKGLNGEEVGELIAKMSILGKDGRVEKATFFVQEFTE